MTPLTREQAEERAAQLNAEHPQRTSFRWMARRGDDGWEVARVSLPGGLRTEPLHGAVEARPRPPQADDPRPLPWRDIGGPYGV